MECCWWKQKTRYFTQLKLRLTIGQTTVNWCPALGTVLAMMRVKTEKSEHGLSCFQKKWCSGAWGITAYSEDFKRFTKTLRLVRPLKDSPDIGRRWFGALWNSMFSGMDEHIEFHYSSWYYFSGYFVVLAQWSLGNVNNGRTKIWSWKLYEETSKTERDRMADPKISGAFAKFAINPFPGKNIPIYISDYVLMGLEQVL